MGLNGDARLPRTHFTLDTVVENIVAYFKAGLWVILLYIAPNTLPIQAPKRRPRISPEEPPIITTVRFPVEFIALKFLRLWHLRIHTLHCSLMIKFPSLFPEHFRAHLQTCKETRPP